MFDLSKIAEIEADLARAGSSVAEMCRKAGIAQTTWGRWKRGDFSPSYRAQCSIDEAYRAIVSLDQESEAAE